jgi:crotonobetainyl-CoA:carnitine CoA-transferase CaiB-like acyl-CoA transferase
MTGVLDGIEVLDLSWGIGGPMTGMLLADHGARVTKIEPPGGDPTRAFSGAQVWHRGKRSAVLDLHDPTDRDRLVALATRADVLVESYSPGTTTELGIDFDTLHARNPRLVYCSITAYGDDGRHSGRPGYDALVAARTGHQWESRGVPGGTLARLAGIPPAFPDLVVPDDCWVGAPRPGPLFSGVPWVSVATCYLATLVISAALRVREQTGRGQRVSTSLMQGVLATTLSAWQRVEHAATENFQSWICDPRAPKGVFRCADGRWIHQWVPLPDFVTSAAAGDHLQRTEKTTRPREATTRIGMDVAEMLLLHHYQPLMAAAVAKFPSEPWVALGAEVGVPLQPMRSPEEALQDPAFLADGCITEVADPELGGVRQVGRVYELHACPTDAPAAPASVGTHTGTVRAEADMLLGHAAAPSAPSAPSGPDAPTSPLAGIRVLDLGLAVAGPWGTMMLADLGADVIKVNPLHDGYWMSTHIAMCCNRGKRSIAMNLKDPDAMAILRQLVETADVVAHNMRYDAAVRLGVDYERLRAIKPDLVYCHTRGFEHGAREGLPGNDQTGAALAGPDWLDGGLDHDGIPFWPVVSLGDTGNGFLSAIATVQALYHRDRTGEGQFVDTSIMYAQLLNSSMAWSAADGSRHADRPQLDAMQLGWHACYRLYETVDGWLCVAAVTDEQRAALAAALGVGAVTAATKFAALEPAFRTRTAAAWFAALDAAGVPCEVSTPDFVLDLFDDPEMIARGWVTKYRHPIVGDMEVMGLLFDLSETPGTVQGPPLVPGQDTRTILEELGYDQERIDKLVAGGTILDRRA